MGFTRITLIYVHSWRVSREEKKSVSDISSVRKYTSTKIVKSFVHYSLSGGEKSDLLNNSVPPSRGQCESNVRESLVALNVQCSQSWTASSPWWWSDSLVHSQAYEYFYMAQEVIFLTWIMCFSVFSFISGLRLFFRSEVTIELISVIASQNRAHPQVLQCQGGTNVPAFAARSPRPRRYPDQQLVDY